MNARRRTPVARTPALWLVGGICVTVVLLALLGHRATREWRRSSRLVMQLQAEQTAELLVRALVRDMRGVEASVLRGIDWNEIDINQATELSDLVAASFAKYPYPEVFFSWGRSPDPSDVLFFTRADRRPEWLPGREAPRRFPVTIVTGSDAARRLIDTVVSGARQGRRFVTFETYLGGEVYQVVSRLMYRDVRRDDLEGVFGFAVNRSWVKDNYFPELLAEVARLAGASHLRLAILDQHGQAVAGSLAPSSAVPAVSRSLLPLFFDPELIAPDPLDDLPSGAWSIQVTPAPVGPVTFALLSADQTLIAGAAAAVALAVGLLLTTRALRASAALTKIRCDFVASVTHELKTPLSTIRAIGDTLAGGRLSGPGQVREYAQLLDQEAKRLSRLLDNLLAYSRVTDVSDIYCFDALAPADLVDDSLRGFETQFTQQRFEVCVNIPPDLPLVRADRVAMGLVLDNVIDNALRYSAEQRQVSIEASCRDHMVDIAVRDAGVGIPPDEVERVVNRFVRGRHAGSHGSGLGLAIATRVMQDHGGRLSIQSAVSQGTTVTLALPAMEP